MVCLSFRWLFIESLSPHVNLQRGHCVPWANLQCSSSSCLLFKVTSQTLHLKVCFSFVCLSRSSIDSSNSKSVFFSQLWWLRFYLKRRYLSLPPLCFFNSSTTRSSFFIFVLFLVVFVMCSTQSHATIDSSCRYFYFLCKHHISSYGFYQSVHV